MKLGLEGRVAIITGGGRGIGLEHARMLGAEGVSVFINDIDPQRAADAAESLRAGGMRASSAGGDATDEATVRESIDQVIGEFGRLDILVNNAGIGVNPAHRVEDLPAGDWDRMIGIHMRSTFLWSRGVIAHMKAGGFGRIVNTSSSNFTGGGRPGVAHYSAAKAGIVGFTQTLAKEVGPHGITANAIAPGFVATELIGQFSEDMRDRLRRQNPVGRMCLPEEVAALVTYLCSTQAAFINGECICIDGGRRDFYWG